MVSQPFHILWVNGRFCSETDEALSALDRGFTLGDGLFETMRTVNSRVFRLIQHLSRLRRGAAIIEMPLPSNDEIQDIVEEVLTRVENSEAVVRLTVTRGPNMGRGVGIPADPSPTLAVRATPLVLPSSEAYRRGYSAVVSSIRRNEGSPLSRIKSCNYLDSVLARREAQLRGCDEAIMLNNEGQAACGSVSNLFLVKDGLLWTAPEEAGVLPGVTRECVLEEAEQKQIPIQVSAFNADFLLDADEAFLSNSIIGVMPLTKVGGKNIGPGKPGRLTIQLAEAYERRLIAE